MATVTNSNSFINQLNSQTQAAQASQGTSAAAPKKNEIGQNEFLKMLITQLKNQDPMNPMNDNEFAVDMAQFSQVEQLIAINKKLDQSSSSDVNSLSAYLGKQVSYSSDTVDVQSGKAGSLSVNLPQQASSVKVDILGPSGAVLQTIDGGALGQGKHSIALNNLTTTDGSYKYAVRAYDAKGGAIGNVGVNVAGVVNGFIPGATPKLLVGSQELSPSDIVSVNAAN